MKRKVNVHFIFVLLAAALWGTAGLFVRATEKMYISQTELVFWRASVSALVFGLIILFKDKRLFKVNLGDIWLFVAAGIFSIVLFNYSYYTTMSLASLSAAAVLLYTAPFFVVIISVFLFGERLTANKCIACITAFVGCCLVSGLFDSAHRIGGKAIFFGLLTGFGYALYTVFGELLIKRGYKTLTITFYVFLTAAVCCLPLVNVAKTVSNVIASPKAVVTILLMAVLNTVLPYIFYTLGLTGVEASVAPIIATIEPVVATVIGAAVFGEIVTIGSAAGIVLVLASVVILNLRPITVTANAKINLTLDITGKREDGYHLIDTVMQSVSLCDTIKVASSKKLTVVCNDKSINEQENLAYKAAEIFFSETGCAGGCRIYIKKRIPKAAGLGGGSADAAAVLVALDKLYKTNLTKERLCELALRLGADVPFFIEGGTVRAEGIGEKLTPLTPLRTGCFVLASVDKKPSTAQMYKELDSKPLPAVDTEAAIAAIDAGDINSICNAFGNSFTAVWQNSLLQKRLYELGADGVFLSGSGPTWCGLFSNKRKAIAAKKQLKNENIEAYFALPCDFALRFE